MMMRLDQVTVRIVVADRNDGTGYIVHAVDVDLTRHWPTQIRNRPAIGGGQYVASLSSLRFNHKDFGRDDV
jgi:hypothetical protein